jgi:hypothetical protein
VCDCGNETIVQSNSLRNGRSQSCGCLRNEVTSKRSIKDLTGKKFGQLTVVERAESKNSQVKWRCKCDCGNEIIVIGSNLSSEHTKSCGCYTKKLISESSKKNYGEATLNTLFNQHKWRAREKNREFSLTKDEFRKLIFSNCFYCGREPSQRSINRYSNGDTIYNGLDRIDNSKGYIEDNVRPCCRQCNVAKNKHSEKDFKIWAKSVYENLKKLGTL